MNILSNLRPAKGSTKSRKRIARGEGSGHGNTATRGLKGAKSRSGYHRKFNHEGGQTPIQRRLPKRGFKNINRIEYVAFNLSELQYFADKHNLTDISFETLRQCHLVQQNDKVKLLAKGNLSKPLTVKLHAASEKAKQAVEAAGGSFEPIA